MNDRSGGQNPSTECRQKFLVTCTVVYFFKSEVVDFKPYLESYKESLALSVMPFTEDRIKDVSTFHTDGLVSGMVRRIKFVTINVVPVHDKNCLHNRTFHDLHCTILTNHKVGMFCHLFLRPCLNTTISMVEDYG